MSTQHPFCNHLSPEVHPSFWVKHSQDDQHCPPRDHACLHNLWHPIYCRQHLHSRHFYSNVHLWTNSKTKGRHLEIKDIKMQIQNNFKQITQQSHKFHCIPQTHACLTLLYILMDYMKTVHILFCKQLNSWKQMWKDFPCLPSLLFKLSIIYIDNQLFKEFSVWQIII